MLLAILQIPENVPSNGLPSRYEYTCGALAMALFKASIAFLDSAPFDRNQTKAAFHHTCTGAGGTLARLRTHASGEKGEWGRGQGINR